MDLSALRLEYARETLSRDQLADHPIAQFQHWFNQAQQAEIPDPNAMQIATVSNDGVPSIRTVLLKSFDESGFVFYTNYNSQKAKEIEQTAHVSLLFFWKELERQVEISGTAQRVSTAESLRYFASRPEGSQLGAWASQQSTVIESASWLQNQLTNIKQKFKDGHIPLPNFWGGYRINYHKIEFWQGRPNRLHDRFEYRLQDNKQWDIVRLSP